MAKHRLYIETSVLFAYTLAKAKEPERYEAARGLFENVRRGEFQAITSFYALLELHTLAVRNAESWEQGVKNANFCLLAVLQTGLLVVGMLSRAERLLNERRFRLITDSSDIAHAISAYLHGCQVIVTYDSHFDPITDIINVATPEQLLATV